jgi:2-phospho-L-lactate guanylyltransferase
VREPLARAMLEDVLSVCREVGETVLARGGGGLGAAVGAELEAVTAGPVLVVNADLPAVTPRDLWTLLGAVPPDGLALVEAADGTTNALALFSPGLYRPLYGPGSAGRFHALARSRAVDLPNLADDVDTFADLERLRGRLGPRTRAALRDAA